MKKVTFPGTRIIPGVAFTGCIAVLLFSMGCQKVADDKDLSDFGKVVLVADNASYGPAHIDTLQHNSWGLAWAPSGIAWVNSQAGHVSALYDATGATIRAAVKIPSPGDTVGGNPTGIVFNSGPGFVLSNKVKAAFLFVGVDGVLSGWNGAANTRALVIHN